VSPAGLEGDPGALRLLAGEGIASAADVLARAEVVRDLPDRSNHVLRVAGQVFRVKREKRSARSREARGLRLARDAGVPAARVAFEGRDPRLGSMVGTFDLGAARPLDDLLREGRLDAAARRATLAALARAAAALHEAGLHHRDLYLNHVYVDPGASSPSVVLIDLERVGRHLGVLGRWVVKDLAAVEASIPAGTLSATDRARFLVHYLRARGDAVRALAAGLGRRVARKAARIRRHVPRTPVGAAARR
jgi:hypothetical protein